ncbi:MAG: ATP-binding protein [bacterium]|nr:ATP-binding protein [Candidatus Kapabacteria bacterium]
MDARTLRQIIEVGETDTVEFKRKFSGFEKIAREMIALANTRGGVLLIGVDDDGSIVGVPSEKSEIELIEVTAEHYVDPPIEAEIDIVDIDGEDVIVVRIPESCDKPHRLVVDGLSARREGTGEFAAGVFIRQGERSIAASNEVARVLAASHPETPPLRLEIGEIEQTLFDYLRKHERITVAQYRKLVNISQRRASRSLVRLVRAGLVRIFTNEAEDYYTLA